jgi:hypothetical protein
MSLCGERALERAVDFGHVSGQTTPKNEMLQLSDHM